MLLCSFIEKLCSKQENIKTGCTFNFDHQCKISYPYSKIKNRWKAFAKKLKFHISSLTFPYLFITTKFHKNPVKLHLLLVVITVIVVMLVQNFSIY